MKKYIFNLQVLLIVLCFSCFKEDKKDEQFNELFEIYQSLSKDYQYLEMTLEYDSGNLKGTFYTVDSLGQQSYLRDF